jgi:PIN domain nuclease of toxin-antitoxin system
MPSNHYLLDTHALIWFQEDNSKMPTSIMDLIQNPDNTILFSQVSLFEITIKQKIGKLPAFYATIEEIYQQCIKDGFTFLNIQNQHIYNYNNITLLVDHRDPFDRLLIATASAEDLAIISSDEKLKLYPDVVKVIW